MKQCVIAITVWLAAWLLNGPLLAESRVPLSQRVAAVQQTARENAVCQAIQPFYWEVGNGLGRRASGQEGQRAPAAATPMAIASATKWLFGAYVAQVRNGQFSPADIQALTMRSGYVSYQHRLCVKRTDKRQNALTVAECFSESALLAGRNDALTPKAIGQFHYNGGHFQFWAVQNDLGSLNNAGLAQRLNTVLGPELQIAFDSPQLPGGACMTAENYGRFLQKLLNGELVLGAYLGQHPVCANGAGCPGEAGHSPLADDMRWHYSLGHWVEDDPDTGDGAFSSAGAFGFYPWIDKDKTHYGLIARKAGVLFDRPAPDSARCGALMRRAWIKGTAP